MNLAHGSTHASAQPLKIDVGGQPVSALSLCPPAPIACLVLAHGAGAGMTHPFMAAFAEGLAERRVATLRYQFPAMDHGVRRPDPPPVAHAAVRAAVAAALKLHPGLSLIAGGKSYGGRMTSQAQAGAPLPGVVGLLFVGFPLHPAGQPSTSRAKHLADVQLPMLFLQGARDALAVSTLLKPVVAELGERASLVFFEHADHSFHVPVSSGLGDERVLSDVLDAAARWIGSIAVGC
jgi:predicted alpha/beta-hydrolase family hydrolase